MCVLDAEDDVPAPVVGEEEDAADEEADPTALVAIARALCEIWPEESDEDPVAWEEAL